MSSIPDLVNELSDSLAAGEFGDCREILDEIMDLCVVDSDFPQDAVDVILATRQDVKFSFCSVDGWGYDEFDENGVEINIAWFEKNKDNL